MPFFGARDVRVISCRTSPCALPRAYRHGILAPTIWQHRPATVTSDVFGSRVSAAFSCPGGMEMMKRFATVTVLFFCLALVVACASDKGPAELAIKAAEEALNTVKAEASKYVPDQLKKVEDALKAAKDSFGKGDYKAALEGSKDLAAKAKDLAAAAAAKKAELTKSWDELSAGIPKAAEELKAKIDALSKAKKLPAGVEKSAVDAAKAGYDEAGNVSDAVAKAKAVKDKLAGLMASLAGQAQAAKK